jgi:hypothetical protein
MVVRGGQEELIFPEPDAAIGRMQLEQIFVAGRVLLGEPATVFSDKQLGRVLIN